jgi:glycosyltransferase involved in cell wall biosynthesis
MMNNISVITICFNNLADLRSTCASVDRQTTLPAEHWIINGSTTTDIEKWLSQTPQPTYRRWVNEGDKGIADAFNKGIHKITHGIIHLLHAGDRYAGDDVLTAVSNFFATTPSVQWISGKIMLLRGGELTVVGKPFDITKLYRGMRSVLHPTWFVRREVYGRIGLFNGDYRIAMDYDMMCRIANEPYAFINITTTYFDNTGISSVKYLDSLKENIKVYESHFGYSLKCRLWQFRLKLLHLLLQTSIGKWLYRIKKKAGLENV